MGIGYVADTKSFEFAQRSAHRLHSTIPVSDRGLVPYVATQGAAVHNGSKSERQRAMVLPSLVLNNDGEGGWKIGRGLFQVERPYQPWSGEILIRSERRMRSGQARWEVEPLAFSPKIARAMNAKG